MKEETELIRLMNSGSGLPVTRSLLNSALLLTAILALLVLPGCTTTRTAQLPPIPSRPDGRVDAGKFVWIDLLTENTRDAAIFYQGLFGWRVKQSAGDEAYLVISLDGKPIGGMTAVADRDGKAPESWWLLSLSVDNVDQSVAVIKQNGGKLLQGPVDDAGRGRMALVADPGGAPLILLRAAGGDPADVKAVVGERFWTDLFTRDANAAEAFYKPLAGFQRTQVEAGVGHRYLILNQHGRARAGLVELQWDDLEDNWMPYVMVENVKSTISKARELGGSLILEKNDVAILVDPTGAVFGVQTQRQRR
jgi:predicted enzyme related to lactoylglutathione lyase